PAHLSHFYPTAPDRVREVSKLSKAGFDLTMAPALTLDDVIAGGRAILSNAYPLAEHVGYIMNSRVGFPTNHMSSPQRFAAKRSLDTINAMPKPYAVAELACQSVPRCLWYPHSFPDDAPIPPDYRERFAELWSGYTSADAHHLIHPDLLIAGFAPLHMAIEAARTAERDGHADLGYAVKTQLVLNTLEMERARFQESLYPELQFFRYIVPAVLTEQVPRSQKTYFSYESAIVEIMEQTWERVEQEVRTGQPGAATNFLTTLQAYYPGDSEQGLSPHLSPYLARSLLQYAGRSNIDMVGILRGLREGGLNWVDSLIEEVQALPGRPVLANAELETFVSQAVETEAAVPSLAEVRDAAAALLDENDIFTFRRALANAPGVKQGTAPVVTVDIMGDEAHATVRYQTNGNRHRVPLAINLGDGTISIATIDSQPLDPSIADRLKAVVGSAIVAVKAEQEAAAAAQTTESSAAGTSRGTLDKAPPPDKPARAAPKVKTRGTPTEEPEEPVVEAEAEPTATLVSGIDIDTVTQLLTAHGVTGIEPETVVQKLRFIAERAAAANARFGHRAPLTNIRHGQEVKLREVKWRTGSGTQLRIYFRELDGGRVELCSLNDKKGTKQQEAYLTNLVAKLRKEQARNQKQQAKDPAKGKGGSKKR
ncbi:MAG TPA: hypothetical protein VFM05_05170, partial [Candidatus Saccharimonadales bacterium]|nr:hypothetical protein [Candidatus Saccharimonadales bacterium]